MGSEARQEPATQEFVATTSSAKQTMAFAADLAARLKAPLLLALHGPLGAGKTTFVRGFVAGLAGNAGIMVQSPTYALMRRYETVPPVHHLDLYRLHETGADPLDSLEALGVLDVIDEGFSLVEWPGEAMWPVASGTVEITQLSPRRRQLRVMVPVDHLRDHLRA